MAAKQLIYDAKARTALRECVDTLSKAVASTKSEKQEEIISEGTDMKQRFQKLANIL